MCKSMKTIELEAAIGANLENIYHTIMDDFSVDKPVKTADVKALRDVLCCTTAFKTISDQFGEKNAKDERNYLDELVFDWYVDLYNETNPKNQINKAEVFALNTPEWFKGKNDVVLSTANKKAATPTTDYTPSVSAVIPDSINKITDAAEKAAVVEIDQKLTTTNATCQQGFVSQVEYVGKFWENYTFSGMMNVNGQVIKAYLLVLHRAPQEWICNTMDEQHFQMFNRYLYVGELNQEDLELANWAEAKLGYEFFRKLKPLAQFLPGESNEQYLTFTAPGSDKNLHILTVNRDKHGFSCGNNAANVNITLPAGTDESKISVESDYFDQSSFQGVDQSVVQLMYHNAKMINASEQLTQILHCFKLKDKFKAVNGIFTTMCEDGGQLDITINPTNEGPVARVIKWVRMSVCDCDKHDA